MTTDTQMNNEKMKVVILTGLSGAGWIEDKGTRAATGAIIDLDITVIDPATGEPAKGSISYAARDMDPYSGALHPGHRGLRVIGPCSFFCGCFDHIH